MGVFTRVGGNLTWIIIPDSKKTISYRLRTLARKRTGNVQQSAYQQNELDTDMSYTHLTQSI